MIKIGGIKLYKHRDYVDWHAPFKIQKVAGECPNGNCPWDHHEPENSYHDPVSVQDLLAIQPRTQMLVLSDYCDHWYVSYNTLSSIFEPDGSTQFRFIEESRRCWNFQPKKIPRNIPITRHGECGYMMYLDSMRWIAVVKSNVPAFGKYGKLPCFIHELARLGNVSIAEIKEGVRKIEQSIPKMSLLLKPWSPQAKDLWEQFLAGDIDGLVTEMQILLKSHDGQYRVAIMFVVAASHGKLSELNRMLGPYHISLPGDFRSAIEYAINRVLARHLDNIKELSKPWWTEFDRMYGIRSELQPA